MFRELLFIWATARFIKEQNGMNFKIDILTAMIFLNYKEDSFSKCLTCGEIKFLHYEN